VKALVDRDVKVAAVTDHFLIDVPRIRELQDIAKGEVTFLPGVELRSDQGGDPIHYICIFPEDCDLAHVWTTLQGKLELTEKAVRDKGGFEKLYVPIEAGATVAKELGGIVSIHAGCKTNSIESIKNHEEFQRRIKYDITKNFIDIFEIGQLRDIERYWEKVFPVTSLERPLVIGSDNHNIRSYSTKHSTWLRCSPTFRGLEMVLREPRHRAWIGDLPPDLQRVRSNSTKYIRSVSFARIGDGNGETWFSGAVPFNSGLVAIIGNKGSGKSALADTLGLLGATRNSGTFSFLNRRRFRHPVSGLAQCFEATLTWESGETVTRCLAEEVAEDEVESVKYLPQEHVENVCNEFSTDGARRFEDELKSVIFSHVPFSQRLGQHSLDDLLSFHTSEKQRRIDALLSELKEISRARADLESRADPLHGSELKRRIARRQQGLEVYDRTRPLRVPDPATEGTQRDPEVARALAQAEQAREAVSAEIAAAERDLAVAEQRRAIAGRLMEKLANFQKQFGSFCASLNADAESLGLDPAALATLVVSDAAVREIERDAQSGIEGLKSRLDGTPGTVGLLGRLDAANQDILLQHNLLDAPNRAYQRYLKEAKEWDSGRAALVGHADDPESLEGLQAGLRLHDELPRQIESRRCEQRRLALEILVEKSGQRSVYGALYQPVQAFIDSHPLAKDKLKLEFRVELIAEGFLERFLGMLAQNRRGSFMGLDEGQARAESLLRGTEWLDALSVGRFLDSVDLALHRDERSPDHSAVLVKDQVRSPHKPEEPLELLYGLDYLKARYVLRWDGKDLALLSPGERGTLLLVFYLLLDKGDVPLVIDQPEGNLDNHTVARVLVDCIWEARKHRQVILVTHNPNLAVVCDADQVIHAELRKAAGNAITYLGGALEDPQLGKYVTDVLEGTRPAFDLRGRKYDVSAP
jgi:ABC-type Mn2+/Zn2+ transport system ATPase subunit